MPVVLEPSWKGRRVVARRVLERRPDGGLHHGDVVGDLIALDDATAVIDTRSGLVEVPLALVTQAKLVPPSTAAELALEDIVARGWRAEHTGHVGGWLLRATGGFTGRANSVLPLKAPGLPVDDAIAAAQEWYAGHGLPMRVQVPVESRRLLDAALGERGWEPSPDVHVMTARLDVLATADRDRAMPVSIAGTPDEAWLQRYRDGQGTGEAARGLLTRHDTVAFAAITAEDGTALAIGRGTVDDDWLGVTAVEVAPDQRRLGLARAVMHALWDWGREHGALRSHLEVQEDNAAALALYGALGYRTHDDYRYRTAP